MGGAPSKPKKVLHINTQAFEAAERGDLGELRRLLDAGASLELRYSHVVPGSETALYRAAACGRTECCKLLLERGAFVEAATYDGWTPLMIAAQEGHLETLRLLLDWGASTTQKQHEGRTAAEVADSDAVRALLGAPHKRTH